MSPMCSMMVAKASGMMVMMAVMARPASNWGPNRENTVLSHSTGMPTQAASATGWKSTMPAQAAAT